MSAVLSPPRPPHRLRSQDFGFAAICRARKIVATLGGRFSLELGIDLDRDPEDVERWALAATLLGNRISTAVAMRTYREFARAGVRTIGDAGGRNREELISLLDEGGYILYGESMAPRLLALAEVVADRYEAAWHARRGGRGPTRARAGPRGSSRLGSGDRRSVPSRTERRVARCRPTARRERGECGAPCQVARGVSRPLNVGRCRPSRLPRSRGGPRATLPLPRFRRVPGRRGVFLRCLRQRAAGPLLKRTAQSTRLPPRPSLAPRPQADRFAFDGERRVARRIMASLPGLNRLS